MTMSAEWPREVRRRADGTGVVYDLPIRPLGGLRWVGLGPIAFSVLFVWSPARSLIRSLQRWSEGGWDDVDWLHVAFGGAFILAGLFPAALGWMIAFGRSRIEYRNRRLRVFEIAGPLRWARRLPVDAVRKLEVSFGVRVNDRAVAQGRWADLGALLLHPESGKPRLLVLGYPRAWLAAMAGELSILMNPPLGVAAGSAITVEEKPIRPQAPAEVEQQPAGSPVRLDSHPDGLTLTVPPVGVWRGSKGLFVFALLWCAFMVIFTAAGLVGVLGDPKGAPWGMLAFAVLFWAIGLGMLAGCVNMGRRRALLRVDGGALRVAQAGLFGARRWDWRREDIADIRAGPSGMEANDRPVLELQVHSREGKKVGLLAGRDEAEICWMVTHLRRALGLSASERGNTMSGNSS